MKIGFDIMKYKIKFKAQDNQIPQTEEELIDIIKKFYLEEYKPEFKDKLRYRDKWVREGNLVFTEDVHLGKDENGIHLIDQIDFVIDFKNKDIAKQVTLNNNDQYFDKFSKQELQFFDNLGFEIPDYVNQETGQNIEDWF